MYLVILSMCLFIGLDLIIMKRCLDNLQQKVFFTYFDRQRWIYIVVLGSILGQLAYVMLEYDKNI